MVDIYLDFTFSSGNATSISADIETNEDTDTETSQLNLYFPEIPKHSTCKITLTTVFYDFEGHIKMKNQTSRSLYSTFTIFSCYCQC